MAIPFMFLLLKVWSQYMKCDGLPDPVCVRQLNTYLLLWVEDNRETIDPVLVSWLLWYNYCLKFKFSVEVLF